MLCLAVSNLEKKQESCIETIEQVLEKINKTLGVDISANVVEDKENVTAYLEVNFDEVLEKLSDTKESSYTSVPYTLDTNYTEISLYPFVLRDIAVWMPTGSKTKELLETIQKEAGELLMKAKMFDEFEKEGRVSYAYRLVFQSYEKTLTDDEVNLIMKKVEVAMEKKGWEVR